MQLHLAARPFDPFGRRLPPTHNRCLRGTSSHDSQHHTSKQRKWIYSSFGTTSGRSIVASRRFGLLRRAVDGNHPSPENFLEDKLNPGVASGYIAVEEHRPGSVAVRFQPEKLIQHAETPSAERPGRPSDGHRRGGLGVVSFRTDHQNHGSVAQHHPKRGLARRHHPGKATLQPYPYALARRCSLAMHVHDGERVAVQEQAREGGIFCGRHAACKNNDGGNANEEGKWLKSNNAPVGKVVARS